MESNIIRESRKVSSWWMMLVIVGFLGMSCNLRGIESNGSNDDGKTDGTKEVTCFTVADCQGAVRSGHPTLPQRSRGMNRR